MIDEFNRQYKPFSSPQLQIEFAAKEKMRSNLKIAYIQHSVGELIRVSKSLYPNKKMIDIAIKKLEETTKGKISRTVAKSSIQRRLKYLRNVLPSKSACQSDGNEDWFFSEEIFNQRRKNVLKNNHKNRLEYFAANYSQLSSIETVILQS